MAWIDFKKAFDTHVWINICLKRYNVNDSLRAFLSSQMTKWKTDIKLSQKGGSISIPYVKIKRRIFQSFTITFLVCNRKKGLAASSAKAKCKTQINNSFLIYCYSWTTSNSMLSQMNPSIASYRQSISSPVISTLTKIKPSDIVIFNDSSSALDVLKTPPYEYPEIEIAELAIYIFTHIHIPTVKTILKIQSNETWLNKWATGTTGCVYFTEKSKPNKNYSINLRPKPDFSISNW